MQCKGWEIFMIFVYLYFYPRSQMVPRSLHHYVKSKTHTLQARSHHQQQLHLPALQVAMTGPGCLSSLTATSQCCIRWTGPWLWIIAGRRGRGTWCPYTHLRKTIFWETLSYPLDIELFLLACLILQELLKTGAGLMEQDWITQVGPQVTLQGTRDQDGTMHI